MAVKKTANETTKKRGRKPAVSKQPSGSESPVIEFFDRKPGEPSPPRSGDEHHEGAPPPAGNKKPLTMPGETAAFRQCLLMMDAVPEDQVDAVVDYCSQRDLKNLNQLDADLWDMGVSQVNKRRRVITYWARSMGLSIGEDLRGHYRQLEPNAPEEPATTTIGKSSIRRFYVEEDAKGMPKMRMAHPGENAMTLKEATEAIRELRAGQGKADEAVVIFNESLGKHVPNSASEWVQKNIAAAWATAREFDRAMIQQIEPPDPLDVMIDQMGKVEAIKGVMNPGGAKDGEPKSDILTVIDAVAKLDGLRGGSRPSWMEDPIQIVALVKSLTPEPKTDPVVEELKARLAANEQALASMRDQAIQGQFAELKAQNEKLQQSIAALQNRPAPGEPTPMTIMSKSVEILEREAKGLRSDIKDLGKDLILAPAGDAPSVVKKAIGNTEKLERLTDELIELTT